MWTITQTGTTQPNDSTGLEAGADMDQCVVTQEDGGLLGLGSDARGGSIVGPRWRLATEATK